MKHFTQEVKEYAAAIHSLTCNANHTDGCGWFYGEGCRTYDYEKIEKLLPQMKQFTVEQLNKLAGILRPWTKDWPK